MMTQENSQVEIYQFHILLLALAQPSADVRFQVF
jgi:hypothetical protein